MTSEAITQVNSFNQIEVIIIEDEESTAQKYAQTLRKLDVENKLLSHIEICTSETLFLSYYTRSKRNVVFIVDLILRRNDISEGIRGAKIVLEHILQTGSNPIYVCSGNLNNLEFTEILENQQILTFDKKPDRTLFVTDVYQKIGQYKASLKEVEINLHIIDCLDQHGNNLFQEASIEENFYNFYLSNNQDYPKGLFIAKNFVITPLPFESSGNFIWETDNATWIVEVNDPTNYDKVNTSIYLQKFYRANKRLPHRIVFKNNNISVFFDNITSFRELKLELLALELSIMDRLIINHFIVFRCIDLYIENEVSVQDVKSILSFSNLMQDKKSLYEILFITSLWETLMLLPGNNIGVVNNKIRDFHDFGFPIVQDIFYCQINEEPDVNSEYISVEIKSVDNCRKTFLREYHKEYLKPIYPLEYLKPFKLIYYQFPNNPLFTNCCRIELILLEEFTFLGINTY